MVIVDVSNKPEILREAVAKGQIRLQRGTLGLIRDGRIEKGDPLYTAKIAGILAAKNTASLIPMCHPIPLTNVDIDLRIVDDSIVEAKTTVRAKAKTGVEMEALVATAMALLTVWDMTKKYEKDENGQYPLTAVQDLHIVHKVKGKKTDD